MSEKREGTMLEGVAKRIGSTLGVIVAEANKVVRPLSTKRSSAHGTKSRPHRARRKSSSYASGQSEAQKGHAAQQVKRAFRAAARFGLSNIRGIRRRGSGGQGRLPSRSNCKVPQGPPCAVTPSQDMAAVSYVMRSEILQIPRTSAALKAGLAVRVRMGPSTPSICKLGSNETSHRGEQVENRTGLADQRVGPHHSSRRFGLGTVVNAEEHHLRQGSDAANF